MLEYITSNDSLAVPTLTALDVLVLGVHSLDYMLS